MKHFSLLGSVFRSSALKPPSSDLEESLKASGMLGQKPNLVNVKRREIETASVGSRSRSVLSTASGHRSRNTIITPLVQKKQPQDILDDLETSSLSSRVQTTEGIIDRGENEAPNVFYRKYLGKNAPPSTANFIQLNEFLDRLLSESDQNDPLVRSEAFDFVFTEVIRQYFMECGGQGRLLDKLRLFYTSLAQHIPKLRTSFETELTRLNDVIKVCDDDIEKLQQQLVPAEEKKKHLDSIISELKNEQQLLADHLDGLNRSIAVTSKELTEMKLEREKLDSRIVQKDQKLVQLNQKLRELDNVSATSTKSTVQVAEQMKKLASDIEQRKKKVAELKAGNQNIKVQIKRADVEIENLETMIEESQKYVEMFEKHVQADLVIKTRRSPVLEEARRRREEEVTTKNNPTTQIFKETTEGDTVVDIPSEGVSISTYDDFAALKQTILENTETFQVSRTEIKGAENGDFDLMTANPSDESSLDFIRLFASKVMSDVIDQAVRKVSLKECSTQTLAKPPVYKETNKRSRRTSSAAISIPSGRSARTARTCRSATGEISILCEPEESDTLSFIEMIPEDYSDREPKTLGWMTKNIRMIYDEKYQSDLVILSNKKKKSSLLGFPEFTFDLACRKHSLDFMAYQFCWDIYNTGVDLRDSSPEVDMFMNVLDRKVSREQLAFMLKCRDDILKVGAVVNVKTEDQTEQITQYYLSQDQIEPALQRWWRHRYHSKLLHHIMSFAVARPAVHLEATKRYISMDNILSVMIDEFSKDTIEQMSELLRVSRIIPRMTESKFNEFVKTMIPSLTVQDCNKFYRATVSKSANRKDISAKQFRSAFNAMSLLFSREKPQEQDSDMVELLEYIGLEWARRKDSMTFVLRYFEGVLSEHPDNLTIRALVTDAQRFEQMLCHSITIKNAQEACMNYFQLVFCLDTLFSSVHSFDVKMGEESLVSLECCVKECWLDSRFEHDPYD